MKFSLIVFLSKIVSSTNEQFSVNVTSVLVSNLWKNDKNQTKNGFLNELKIAFNEKTDYIYGHKFYPSSGFYYNENCYIPLCSHITQYLFSNRAKDSEPCFLKFLFTYNNLQFLYKNQFKAYTGKKQIFKNFKKIIKTSNDLVEFENDVIEVRMANIKSIIGKLMTFNLKKLDILLLVVNDKYLKKKMKTNILYFKSTSTCLESLKDFAESKSFLRMITNFEEVRNCESKNYVESSYFKLYIEEVFEKVLQVLRNQKLDDFRILPLTRLLIHKCIEHLIYVISTEQLCLPIEDEYEIDYYYEQILFLIKNSIIKLIDDFDKYLGDQKSSLFCKILNRFELKVKIMQSKVINNLIESKYNIYFSKILDKEIETLEDYINFEKIVCDYHNMMACILNKYNKGNKMPEIEYVTSTFNDGYHYKIMKAIEINYENLNEKCRIKGCTSEGDKVDLCLNVDYFLYQKTKLLISFETVRDKCINEIEIIGEFYKKIMIDNYLDEKPIENDMNKNKDGKEITILFPFYRIITSIYSYILNMFNLY